MANSREEAAQEAVQEALQKRIGEPPFPGEYYQTRVIVATERSAVIEAFDREGSLSETYLVEWKVRQI